jgi:hypothetical protein
MLHRGYALTSSPIKLALEFSHTNAGNYAHEWNLHLSTEHFPIPWTWNGKRHGEFLSSLLCITCLFTMSWGYKVEFSIGRAAPLLLCHICHSIADNSAYVSWTFYATTTNFTLLDFYATTTNFTLLDWQVDVHWYMPCLTFVQKSIE